MKFRIFSAISLLYILAVSCAGDSAGERIHLDFETRRAEVARPGLYAVFDSDMTRQERQAMEFLYAYMPMPDMTDYTGEFYLDNVRARSRPVRRCHGAGMFLNANSGTLLFLYESTMRVLTVVAWFSMPS